MTKFRLIPTLVMKGLSITPIAVSANRAALVLSLFFLCVNARAEMTFPNLFGDNMVLQQKGKNTIWGWADAKIKGDTVVLSSAAVAKPVAVRYAWAMNPSQRNLLYNKEGIPASPFHTDDWPLFKADKNIVEVLNQEKSRTTKLLIGNALP